MEQIDMNCEVFQNNFEYGQRIDLIKKHIEL